MAVNQLEKPDTSPELQKILSAGMRATISMDTAKLLELEQSEDYIAYNQLLRLLQKGDTNSLAQETGPLYDKVFYIADRIDVAHHGEPMTIYVGPQSFVRINDKVRAEGLPTITDLRNKTHEGVLFSGVGALQIQTKDGIRIPLMQRDPAAPTDAGKYTLPAGRADKTPGLTAYEEILEELVLFGKKDNKMYLIVPYIQDGGISEEKALQLAAIARGTYINTFLKIGNSSLNKIDELISATPIIVPMSVSQKGESIRTVFQDENGNISYEIREGGFFPIHDIPVNTYEMVRSFSLDLTDFEGIISGDGDGFGRNSQLFTLSEIQKMNLAKDVVVSLKGAIELGVFE